MTIMKKTKFASLKNGLLCPRCNSHLVDTCGKDITLSDKVTKLTHCDICDFQSTYNINTMKLSKTY